MALPPYWFAIEEDPQAGWFWTLYSLRGGYPIARSVKRFDSDGRCAGAARRARDNTFKIEADLYGLEDEQKPKKWRKLEE